MPMRPPPVPSSSTTGERVVPFDQGLTVRAEAVDARCHLDPDCTEGSPGRAGGDTNPTLWAREPHSASAGRRPILEIFGVEVATVAAVVGQVNRQSVEAGVGVMT